VLQESTSAHALPDRSRVLPLSGVRIVELGRFASAPSCATVLADWGAAVIKVEPPSGDPARGPGALAGTGINPRFDVHNRSRRSIALDLRQADGSAALRRLLASADVFVTNLRPNSLERLGLATIALRNEFPRLIIAHVTGYGIDTSWANERSYDHGAFWSYAGVGAMFSQRDGEPPQAAGGFGDRATGAMLAGAICAALLSAERTGEGSYITTSLVQAGTWLAASDLSDEVAAPGRPRPTRRHEAPIPTLNCFRTADGRWLWLQVMTPERDWSRLAAALDAPWLDDDPRFRGGEATKLAASREILVDTFDEIFRRRTLAEWAVRLTDHDLTWSPVRTLAEVAQDPELRQSTAFTQVVDRFGGSHDSVNTPCTFHDVPQRTRTAAPAVGEHSDEILRELGYQPAEIARLHDSAVVVDACLPASPTTARPTDRQSPDGDLSSR
jgi:crotonobetainyl-CoA:carnitine CoA-transferase CaiB-like acyl-CoA transferase